MNKKIVIVVAGLIALVALSPIMASGQQGPDATQIEISDELNKVEFVHFEEGTEFTIEFDKNPAQTVTMQGTITYGDDYNGNAYTVAIGDDEPRNGVCIDLKKGTYDVTVTAGEVTVSGTIEVP